MINELMCGILTRFPRLPRGPFSPCGPGGPINGIEMSQFKNMVSVESQKYKTSQSTSQIKIFKAISNDNDLTGLESTLFRTLLKKEKCSLSINDVTIFSKFFFKISRDKRLRFVVSRFGF